jgi:hypothetical protein
MQSVFEMFLRGHDCSLSDRRCVKQRGGDVHDAMLPGMGRSGAVHAKLAQMLKASQAWLLVRVYLRVLGRKENCHHLDLDGPGRLLLYRRYTAFKTPR